MTKNLTIQKLIFFFRVWIILLIVISCKKNSKQTNENKNNEQAVVKGIVFQGDTIPKILNLEVQDTVYRGLYAYGKLKYDMSIDSIEESNIRRRIIILYTSIDKNHKTFEDIINSRQNAFIDTISDGTFNFKFIFPEAGENELTLALEDQIFLKKYPPGDSIQLPNSRYIFTFDYNLK